jgi:16S rRNA (adenine1518-N6/adenine1519-N6)-dimethyltransferase
MRPKKHLGQHFLAAPAYAEKIAEAVPAAADDHVLEIGPGLGALTTFLIRRFPGLHCVEVDGDVIERLKEKLGEGHYTVHEADALSFDFGRAGFPLHVVGNLPYAKAALVIKKTLLYGNAVRSFTFMVQREVAERIVSLPHRKTNGFLTIFCQYFAAPAILFHVPAGAFFPRPNVDSSVVLMAIPLEQEQRLTPEDRDAFFSFVSRGFSKRRKKVSNALGGTVEERRRCESLLRGMGLNPLSRPEDLGIKEWLGLYHRWKG